MRTGVLPCIFGIFLFLTAGAAMAGGGEESPSLDRILPHIRERHPGRFYDAQGPWRGPDGQLRYRLKWMTPDGRIVWFDADARTGRVLRPDVEMHREMRERGQLRKDDEKFFRDNERKWNRGNRWPREHWGNRPRHGH